MASTTLEVVIAAKDRFSGTANKVIGSLNRLDSAAGKVGKGFGQLGAGLVRASAVGLAAVGTGLAAVAKQTIDWQEAFAGVVKTVDEADLNKAGLTFRDLELSLRKMSTEMPIAAGDLARIAEAAGALGIAGKDITEFTRVVALISTTTDVSAETAATSLGQLSNVLGLTVDDYDNFAATLVDLGNKGASTESQILEMASRAGASARLIGVASDKTLGWSSAVANLGIEVEAGGSALQRFFLMSLDTVASGGADLKQMAKVAGMTGAAYKTAFNKDASGALATFIKGLSKLDQATQLDTLQDLGFKDIRITRMLLGLAANTDNLTNSLDIAGTAWKENTALTEEAGKRFATVKSKLSVLKNGFVDAAITIGEGMVPALGRVADKLSAFLKLDENRAALKRIGEDVGRFIDGIDWSSVLADARSFVGLLKSAAEYAMGILGAVNKLPNELKAAGLGFLAINKASGGLVGQGIGNIVGGLSESISRGLFSRLPIIGGVAAMPVRVVNFAEAGLLGGAGGVGGAGATAGTAGAGAAIAAAVKTALIVAPPVIAINEGIAQPIRNLIGAPDLNPERLPANSNVSKPFWEQPGFRWPWESAPAEAQGTQINAMLAETQRTNTLFWNSQTATTDAIVTGLDDSDRILRETTMGTNSTIERASSNNAAQIMYAIRANRPIIDVDVNVSATTVTKTVAVSDRLGPATGSAYGGAPYRGRAIAE